MWACATPTRLQSRCALAERQRREGSGLFFVLCRFEFHRRAVHAVALTGGLRRTTDALRAVIERTRGDVTNALVIARLQDAIGGQSTK